MQTIVYLKNKSFQQILIGCHVYYFGLTITDHIAKVFTVQPCQASGN